MGSRLTIYICVRTCVCVCVRLFLVCVCVCVCVCQMEKSLQGLTSQEKELSSSAETLAQAEQALKELESLDSQAQVSPLHNPARRGCREGPGSPTSPQWTPVCGRASLNVLFFTSCRLNGGAGTTAVFKRISGVRLSYIILCYVNILYLCYIHPFYCSCFILCSFSFSALNCAAY